nr:Chain C, Major immediate-early protein [Human betaherpesvirus 5]
ELKRKMIYM